eukprot:8822171-Lingulodinium_polyedra.AAC.1
MHQLSSATSAGDCPLSVKHEYSLRGTLRSFTAGVPQLTLSAIVAVGSTDILVEIIRRVQRIR